MKLQSTSDYVARETARESIDDARTIADGDESVYTIARFEEDMFRYGEYLDGETCSEYLNDRN